MSDESVNQADNLPAWSVRGVPADIRGVVLRMAKKEGVSIGEWLTIAVRDKVKADRQAGRAVAIRGPVSLDEAGRAIDMLSGLAGAGVEIPKGLQRSAVAMMNKVGREVGKGQTQSPVRHAGQRDGQSSEEE
mgnify:FL=1